MAANYYKLKGKVWGGEKGQTKYPLLHTSNGGVTDGDKGLSNSSTFSKRLKKKKKSTKQFANAIGLYLKCKTWHAGSAELCSEFSQQI